MTRSEKTSSTIRKRTTNAVLSEPAVETAVLRSNARSQKSIDCGVSLRTDPAVAAAIALGPLRSLSASALDRLLSNAMTLDVPRGVVDQTQGSSDIHAGLLVSGLLRAFRTTEDGRQLTFATFALAGCWRLRRCTCGGRGRSINRRSRRVASCASTPIRLSR